MFPAIPNETSLKYLSSISANSNREDQIQSYEVTQRIVKDQPWTRIKRVSGMKAHNRNKLTIIAYQNCRLSEWGEHSNCSPQEEHNTATV
jgi:hypothetical protein